MLKLKSEQSLRQCGTWRQLWLKVMIIGWMLVGIVACDQPVMQAQRSQIAEIVARGELRVGMIYSGTGYYHGPTGPEGFDYELARQFADYLGVDLKINATYTMSDMLALLEKGEVDLLATAMTVTPGRHDSMRFAPPYARVDQALVYRMGAPRPRNLGELAGTLRVVAGSSHVETLTRLQQSYPSLSWQETSEQEAEELMDRVLAGEIAYTVVDSSTLAHYRRYHPELAVAFQISTEEPVGWVFARSNDDSFYAVLIEFFGAMQQQGVLSSLDEKYYGHLDKFDYVDTKAFLRAVQTRLPRYRKYFERYAEDLDWRLLAALSYQESHWKPDARSVTGVRGLMMLTQDTASYLGISDRTDPEQSIAGGARYLRQLITRVPEKVPEHERVWFALASYNVGLGHVLDAARITRLRGGNPHSWREVKESLPLLRLKKWYRQASLGYVRGDVPVRYVDAIRRYYDMLVYIDERASTPGATSRPSAVEPENETDSAAEAADKAAIDALDGSSQEPLEEPAEDEGP